MDLLTAMWKLVDEYGIDEVRDKVDMIASEIENDEEDDDDEEESGR